MRCSKHKKHDRSNARITATIERVAASIARTAATAKLLHSEAMLQLARIPPQAHQLHACQL